MTDTAGEAGGKALDPDASAPRSQRLGVLLAVATTFVFTIQDVLTKLLIVDYPVTQLLLVRFWIFATFMVAMLLATRGLAGLKAAANANRPGLQIARSVLLLVEIGLFASALYFLGLAELHAILAVAPLIATALARPLLGEKVGWRRYLAVAVGFVGALVIIRPGTGVFGIGSVIALATCFSWALYNLLTRLTMRTDGMETGLLYTGVIAALAVTPFGIGDWRPMTGDAWTLLIALSLTAIGGHGLLMLALRHADASVIQPLLYMMLVWATLFGFVIFSELPDLWTVVGAVIVVASGLFVIWREHQLARRQARQPTPATAD